MVVLNCVFLLTKVLAGEKEKSAFTDVRRIVEKKHAKELVSLFTCSNVLCHMLYDTLD